MSSFLSLFGVSWDSIDKKIDDEFPDISFIEGEELQVIANDDDRPVIIDVREAKEFAVSHLTDALHIESALAIAQALPDKETPIVVYCSVGYRSAGVAAELESLGYSSARNLRHSIFAWAEQQRPLTDGQGSTTSVHPYNRIWGSLVSRSLHAYEP